MSNLGPQQQNSSYAGILQVPGGITPQLQQVQDGEGNGTGLWLSSAGTSASTADSFTVSVNGTSISGAAPRLISDGFGDYLSVLDFGAYNNGTHATETTAAIQAAITAITTNNGGTLYFPPGIYNVNATFTINSSNVTLLGAGGNSFHDAGTGATAATTFNWVGASSLTSYLFNFVTPANVNASVRVGGGLQRCQISCNAGLAGGLNIISWRDGAFKNIFVLDPVVTAFRVSCWNTGVEVPEAADTQRCYFYNCLSKSVGSVAVHSAKFFTITAEYGTSMNANVSFNTFQYCTCQVYDGTAWYVYQGDNNIFTSCAVYVLGTAKGLELWCDSNYFIDFSCGGYPSKLYVYGTVSGNTIDPKQNCFLFSDNGNGTYYPNVDAGCQVYWTGSNGVQTKAKINKLYLADSDSEAISLYSNASSTTSLHIKNTASDAIRISDLTQSWGISCAPNSLRITPVSGTTSSSYLNLGNNANVQIRLLMQDRKSVV